MEKVRSATLQEEEEASIVQIHSDLGSGVYEMGVYDPYSIAASLNHGRKLKHPLYWLSKRLFDFLAAGAALCVLSPVLLLIAYLIKRDSEGPVFFRQSRVGERLRIFTILKFRTMYEGSEKTPMSIFDKNLNSYRRPTTTEDPRITKIGSFLRKWSLDELPQLLNILVGDMSLVGPRPLTIAESFNIPETALTRYSVPPGLTGLAQIESRHVVINPSRFDEDLAYIEALSWKQDLKLMIRTIAHIRQR